MSIVGSVKARRKPNISGISQELQLRDQDLAKFAQYVKAWVRPGPLNSVSDFEYHLSSLMEALGDARKVVGHKPTRARGSTAPWWNEDCKLKHGEYYENRSCPDSEAEAWKRFKHVVRAAKRGHWRKQVENATIDSQVFKLMQWAKPKIDRDPPALKIAEYTWTSDQLE